MPLRLRDIWWSLFFALIVTLLLRVFVFAIYKIPTSSMQPNLLTGDFVIAYKLPYGFRFDSFMQDKIFSLKKPNRGEIFVFQLPSNPKVKYIKRVLAIEGDSLAIKEDKLIINGVEAQYKNLGPYQESAYLHINEESLLKMKHKVLFMDKKNKSNYGPIKVEAGSVFVLGDNRDSSDDSRYWGLVPLNTIESKVFGIWFSIDIKSRAKDNVFNKIRWQRVFKGVN